MFEVRNMKLWCIQIYLSFPFRFSPIGCHVQRVLDLLGQFNRDFFLWFFMVHVVPVNLLIRLDRLGLLSSYIVK